MVDDYGDDIPLVEVKLSDTHVLPPARRWAVTLDNGGLVFVNSEDLVAD